MTAGNSKVLLEDIDNVIKDSCIPWKNYKNKNIMITGATGFVGSLLCRCFLAANKEYDLNSIIIALVRNSDKAIFVFGNLVNDDSLVIVNSDICKEMAINIDVDIIFHCAAVTTSKYMVTKPVETIETSFCGTRNILNIALEKKVESFVYISSMEVYGSFENSVEVKENDMGMIDPLEVRSNYPQSKRMCENMCIAYYHEYGVPVKIARLAQMFGAGVSFDDNRVFSQFAKAVINGDNIVMHTDGLSEGNYCYSSDAIRALMMLAIYGNNSEAYNISNPATHTTIGDMAKMVCHDIADNQISVVYDIPTENIYGYAKKTKMKLNSDKMQSLGWKPAIDLKEAYKRLVSYYLETQ
jgi:nucleoside-diphosphate-sugar epimerase